MVEKHQSNLFCTYYQAHVNGTFCWFVTALLRSYEHMVFDRTIDVENSILEFFVAPGAERHFLSIMSYFQEQGYIDQLKELPNRLQSDEQL